MWPRILRAFSLGTVLLAATWGFAQSQFDKARYLKPPGPGQKKEKRVNGVLLFDSAAKEVQFLRKGGATEFGIRYEAITRLVYEQSGLPWEEDPWRHTTLEPKKNFLTIHYKDATGASQFVLVELDSKNFQLVLATAEAQTGKKPERIR